MIDKWTEFKVTASAAIGLEHDVLHFLLGTLFFVIFAILLRNRQHNLPIALLGVIFLQLVNEAFDAVQWFLWTQAVAWDEALRDTVITLLLPSSFVLSALLQRDQRSR